VCEEKVHARKAEEELIITNHDKVEELS